MQLFTLLAIFQWVTLTVALTPRSVGKSLIRSKQVSMKTPKLPALFSNMSMSLNQFSGRDFGLFSRQGEECVDPGYAPCSDGVHCCPAGGNCVIGGCCDAGEQLCGTDGCYNPDTETCCSDGTHCDSGQDCVEGGCCSSGEQPCGETKCYDPATEICCDSGNPGSCDKGKECCGSDYCYDPETEQCCSNGQGTCDLDKTCCQEQCCYSYATCEADGFCSGITCTQTSTVKSTSYAIFQKTVTILKAKEEGDDGGGDEPEFSCAPMTVTNSQSDTLELGDDCMLTYSAASGSAETTEASSPSASSTPALAGRTPVLLQPRATADCYYTTTSVSISVIPASTTLTQTVTEETVNEKFSCPPMSVTNAAGDELSLDEECQLEISLAPPTASPTQTSLSGAHRLRASKTVLGCCVVAFLGFW